jgi:enoyl-CoA hydratase
MEIILSAKAIDAQEAYRLGLVNKIFPKESLLEEARRFAQGFTQKGGIALRLAMEAVHQGLNLPLEKGLELEASLAGLSWATEDAKEGTRAFLEKRNPIFKDR